MLATCIPAALLALAPPAPLAAATAPAPSSTWYVDVNAVGPGTGTSGNPYTSIQYAIDQAGTLSGDTLLVRPGTYAELVDYAGKTLSIVSTDGPALTTIDASAVVAADTSCVRIDSGEGPAARLEGFTLEGSFGTFDAGTYRGGCIYLVGTSPTIADCVLRGGTADLGAGLWSQGGSPRVERTTFIDNASPTILSGGGAYLEGGAPDLEDCDFIGNEAWGLGGAGLFADSASLVLRDCRFSFAGGYGGGCGAYLDATSAVIEDCRFESSVSLADNGGGLLVAAGSVVTAERCVFADNSLQDDHTGGGVYVAAMGDLTVRASSFEGNFSARGGAAANFGTLSIEDSSLFDNTAQSFSFLDGRGGGVYAAAGASTQLVRCVLAGNQAIPGLGGGGEGGAVFGPALLENCTVVGNTAVNAGGGACGASLLNTIHRDNLPAALCAAPSVTYSDVEGGAAGVGNIDLDPLFWDPAGRDYHLLLGSPCIDAGDPTSPLDPDGTRADMGAFPHEGSYSVAYCTAGTSAIGCQALVASAGTPSATASSGFVVSAGGLEGQRSGLVFYGVNGRQAQPWGNGTSFQCVVPPVRRSQVLASGGTSGVCNGALSVDLNARWCPTCPKPHHNPGAGAVVQAQAWFRDPFNTSNRTTALSDALELQVQP